jgi:guanylate kinase
MLNKKNPLLIVISGPTGSGKTTVAKRVVAEMEMATFSISHTTREKRPGEVDGVDYHFVSEEDFLKMVYQGEFLEYAKVHKNLYGTHKNEWERAKKDGKDLVLDIDVQGGEQVLKSFDDAILIFVLPPSFDELIRRISIRKEENDFDLETRLKTALSELDFADNYHYNIINEKVDAVVEEVKQIVQASRKRSFYLKEFRQSFKMKIERYLRDKNV